MVQVGCSQGPKGAKKRKKRGQNRGKGREKTGKGREKGGTERENKGDLEGKRPDFQVKIRPFAVYRMCFYALVSRPRPARFRAERTAMVSTGAPMMATAALKMEAGSFRGMTATATVNVSPSSRMPS